MYSHMYGTFVPGVIVERLFQEKVILIYDRTYSHVIRKRRKGVNEEHEQGKSNKEIK